MTRRRLVFPAVLALVLPAASACDPRPTSTDHLASAAAGEDETEARRLVASGADPNGTLTDGATPLYVAAHSRSVPMVRILLDLGADPNRPVPAWESRTPLIAAAEKGTPEIVHLLMSRGGDPHRRGRDGKSALDVAKNRGDERIVRALTGAPSRSRERGRSKVARTRT